jgi:beta-glucosidase
MDWFEAAGGFVNDMLVRFADRIRNFYFLDGIRDATDFIGFNYYFHNRVDWGFNKNRNESVSDMGWEIYPEGIYHVLKKLKKYNLPIYITENGLADARDAQRTKFITDHLAWVRRAIDEDVDVRGYFHWSLLDNFEWDKGFWPRFGLIEIDYKSLERKIRPSAFAYKEIIQQWLERA